MDSHIFNIVYVLKQEIETIKMCRTDKDDIEYHVVLQWLTNRIRILEQEE